MDKYYYAVLVLCLQLNMLKALNEENLNVELLISKTGAAGYLTPLPENCSTILEDFADYASKFTKCSLLHARPIRICEKCIDDYMNFQNKYHELVTKVVNGTSCKSIYISYDRLDAVLQYHDNILSIWNQGNCHACYNWTNAVPVLSNETKNFNEKFNATMTCIEKYMKASNDCEVVCNNCMQSYFQLDNYYKTLSEDSIGVDSICMDIVDSMNATRYIWSKDLKCCKVRKTPEIIFLCCTGIISLLPLLYYIVLRFCSPMRDLPNVLKQSRFKQTILKSFGKR